MIVERLYQLSKDLDGVQPKRNIDSESKYMYAGCPINSIHFDFFEIIIFTLCIFIAIAITI